ncbi:MAG TPA: NADH-ubiquinone oxidoreductase-F iron-sulfur binding region domain-containing protein, partial [Chloroflexota bacterium]
MIETPQRPTSTIGATRPLSPATLPTPRLLVDGLTVRESLADYQQRGGYSASSWQRSPQDIVQEITASGLRGRGGSGFPSGEKWQLVAAGPGAHVLLINGAESEPASGKDHLLLTLRPHLVLEGALLAARAVAAGEIVCYLHADAGQVRRGVEAAWRELQASGRRLPRFRIVTAPAAYVAGEQSAAIQRANGKPALPTFKPPRAHERGVRGHPTLVHNVETLANVPGILREGAVAFRSVGVPELPGTMLVTLSGQINSPGVYEVPTGVSLDWVLEHLGGGTPGGAAIQAILPGGYFAGWLSGETLEHGVTLDAQSLHMYGVGLGSGAITVITDSVCGLTQAVTLTQFFARESARQCGACTFGTQAMAQALERLAAGQPAPFDVERL